VQSLNGKLAALHRFLSKSAESSIPFFKTLKGCAKTFQWSDEEEEAFQGMKTYTASTPTLVAPADDENLFLYIAVGKESDNSVLVVERSGCQLHIYLINRASKYVEVRYPVLDKSALAIAHTFRRLRRCFEGGSYKESYQVAESHKGGSYKLKDMEGKAIPRNWNACNIR
jgi:hypothetical protein